MQLYGNYFNYNGTTSRFTNYNLIFANIETKENYELASKGETVSIFNHRNNKLYYVATDFDTDGLQFDIEIITDDGSVLTDSQQSEIKTWLFYSKGFRTLYPVDCNSLTQDSYFINCRFTNPSIVYGNGGVIGYKATMECASPFCMKDESSQTYTAFSSNISVAVSSEPQEYIYPKVIFTTGSTGGTVQIRNLTDSSTRFTKFESLPANTEITMIGATNYITSGYYNYFTNKNFVRLLNGTNSLSVTGNVATMTIYWNDVGYIL